MPAHMCKAFEVPLYADLFTCTAADLFTCTAADLLSCTAADLFSVTRTLIQ